MNKNRHVQYVHQKRCLRASSWIPSGCSLRVGGILSADNPPVDVVCLRGEVDTDKPDRSVERYEEFHEPFLHLL